ncbi:hypothetical protein E2986_04172 [Frieseomelitta varia]|uniref:D-3-phosphoglycerate dehydrogenase n=1 Tax=Frieseomelitta varia TaxID=561572 RepID=A0A833S0L1_9HYME|nr:hypothetical protein E2986_04172 [Frieseomelitta varia]
MYMKQNHEGLIVRSETKVTNEVISRCPKIRVIGRAGTGVDNIDLQAATRKGVIVLNTPGANSISACELTCTLICSLARNVPQAVQSLKEGRWDRALYMGFELSGKTLAIIGMGRIGREVARRMQAFGMKVVAFDPLLTQQAAEQIGVAKLSLDEIWSIADYITVHTPLTPETKNLINAKTLENCKQGVYIINVARGGIVNEEALLNALESGRCAGAALDVFNEEPPKHPITLELIAHPKVIATPHLGASTEEAQQRVAEEMAQQFIAISGKSTKYAVTGIVNAPVLQAAMSGENASWIELSKKLGELIGRFLKEKLDVTVHSQIVGGASMREKSFVHTAVLVGILSGQTKNGLNMINAHILAKERGIKMEESYEESADVEAIVVQTDEDHLIKGTIRDNKSLLLSLNDAHFTNGIALTDHVSFYQTNNVQDLAQIVSAFSTKGINICNVSVNGSWTVIQTDKEASVCVNGIESF